MLYVPDNYDQFVKHEAEQQAELDKLPRCSECGHPIQDEHCFEINDELICEKCLNKNHRKQTDDYMDQW